MEVGPAHPTPTVPGARRRPPAAKTAWLHVRRRGARARRALAFIRSFVHSFSRWRVPPLPGAEVSPEASRQHLTAAPGLVPRPQARHHRDGPLGT